MPGWLCRKGRGISSHENLSAMIAMLLAACSSAATEPSEELSAQTARVDTLFYESFESGDLAAWDDLFETQAGNYAVAADPTLAYQGSHVLAARFPADTPGGAGAITKFLPGGDHLHVRVRVRFAASWEGEVKLFLIRASQSPWDSFGVAGSCPTGADFAITNAIAHFGDPGPLRFYSYFLGMQPSGAQCWGNWGWPSPATYYDENFLLSRDQWHTLELEAQLNTPGVADGWQKLWANGTLVAEWLRMTWRTDQRVKWQALTLDNSASAKSQPTMIYFDEVLVTTNRP